MVATRSGAYRLPELVVSVTVLVPSNDLTVVGNGKPFTNPWLPGGIGISHHLDGTVAHPVGGENSR